MRNYTHLSLLKLVQKPLTLVFFILLLSLDLQAQDIYSGSPLIINTEISEPSPELVRADFMVQNFESIVSMQFGMKWNPEVWEFQELLLPEQLPNLTNNSFNTNASPEGGFAIIAWLDGDISGVTLADGTVIFSFLFNKISSAGTEISITGASSTIEIIKIDSGNIVEIGLNSFTNEIIAQQQIRGQIFLDENANCTFEEGENALSGWKVEISNTQSSRLINANYDGSFVFAVDAGTTYKVQAIPPFELWELCQDSYEINTDEDENLPTLEFAAKVIDKCPVLTVDVSTPFLRRCFENTYTVRYNNVGTADAENAYVLVDLDADLDFESSTLEAIDLGDNQFRFELGNLRVSESDFFRIHVTVNCDEAELGQTHCVEANIFPYADCIPNSPTWSEAELQIEARCVEEETLEFKIKNIGAGDMIDAQEFTIIEGMIMLYDSGTERQFKLRSDEEFLYEVPANGRSYRIETSQVPNHPFNGELGITLEGCGEDAMGDFEQGIVTMFPQRGRSSNQDIDCQENRGAYDPNDKQAFPKGYGEENWIKQNTDIEYLIRFQNTGTDTAFNIVVLDTLSDLLDPASVKPLVSSHNYQYEQLDEQVLKFTFPNIMLPDSNINEPMSHGFIRFQIAQQPDLDDDLIIENSAAIYFDFNEPIITNTVQHRVGEGFIETLSSSFESHAPSAALVSPNPFSDAAIIELRNSVPANTYLHLYDLLGREVRRTLITDRELLIERNDLSSGTYLYNVQNAGVSLYSGRLMIQYLD